MILCVQKATAAGVVSFQSPVSGRLVAWNITSGGFLSSDPGLTGAEVGSPLADGLKTNVIGMSNSSSLWNQLPFEIAPEISAGETIYVAFAGKGSAIIVVQENTQ